MASSSGSRSLFPSIFNMQNISSPDQAQGLDLESQLEMQSLNRRQQIANMLLQHGIQPLQGQMAGRFYVAPSWAQGVANLGSAFFGGVLTHQNEAERKRFGTENEKLLQNALRTYQERTAPEVTTTEMPVDPQLQPPTFDIDQVQPDPYQQVQQNKNQAIMQYSPGELQQGAFQKDLDKGAFYTRSEPYNPPATAAMQTVRERTPEEKQNAITELMFSRHPLAAARGQFLMQQQERAQEKADELAVRREGIASNEGIRLEAMKNNAILLRMQIDAREQAGHDASDLKKDLAKQNADLQKTLHAMDIEGRKDVARIAAEAKTQASQNKGQLPAPALKMQQEELDAIGLASSINADLGAFDEQIDEGKLKLGAFENITGTIRNVAGMSTEDSRNLASFKATLEKLRNDSLRLNKGVQTEGDAVRAWNELIANINDSKLVKQRLTEIKTINERAANIHKMNIDAIRKNYNLEPMDTSQYEKQPAAPQGTVPAGNGTIQIQNDADYEALPSGTIFIDPEGKTRKKP